MNSTNMTGGQPVTSPQNANETDKQNSFERREIPNSPFTAIWMENKGWFIVMGAYLITKPETYYSSYENMVRYLKTKPWDILGAWVLALVDSVQKYEATKQKEEPTEDVDYQEVKE